jgi:DNA-binding transcriptional regulator YdaS (Cro superfamily)
MNLITYVSPVGAQTNLAKAIGVTPVLISQWANGRRKVPLDRCVQIEQATGGAVTCEDLRPDKAEYWAYLRDGQAPIAASSAPNGVERRRFGQKSGAGP